MNVKIFPKKIPTFQIFQQALSPTISTLSGLDIDNQQNIQRAHLLVTVSNVSGILPEMVPLTPHTYTPASSMSTLISLRLPPTIFEWGSGFLSVNKPISLTLYHIKEQVSPTLHTSLNETVQTHISIFLY